MIFINVKRINIKEINSNLTWKKGNYGSKGTSLSLPSTYNELLFTVYVTNNTAFKNNIRILNEELQIGNNYFNFGDAQYWLYSQISIHTDTGKFDLTDCTFAGTKTDGTIICYYR